MKVSEHFDSTEFDQKQRHGCPYVPYPEEWIPTRLTHLCGQLEVIRAEFGHKPIRIISGYRSVAYNKLVSGRPRSQHVQGRACDFFVQGLPPSLVHDRVLRLYQDGFLVIGGLGNYPTFTHVDIRPRIRLARWEGTRTES